MPKANCSVIGCSNSLYKINKWEKETCTKSMKIIPGGPTSRLPNSSTPCFTCQDEPNLVKALVSKMNKMSLENKQLKHRSIVKTSTYTRGK